MSARIVMIDGTEIEVEESVNYVRAHMNSARVTNTKPFDEMSFISEGDRVVVNLDHVLYVVGPIPSRGA